MTEVRTTLTIDADVLRAAKIAAARSGMADSEVIEAAFRRDLGFDVLDRLWARNDLPEDEALALALEAQRAARAQCCSAVFDANVIVSALLSPSGTPGQLLTRWRHGEIDLVISPALEEGLRRVLRQPKLAVGISAHEAIAVMAILARHATRFDDDPGPPSLAPPDPDDNYLLVLAETQRRALVSGDHGILSLSGGGPIFSPRQFLLLLET